MKIKIPKQKTRAHYVLFCANSPFQPKRVKLKVAYQRHDKHKLKESLNYE